MKKALILAMALFVFAGCSTKPGESAEEKFLKRFEGYSTMEAKLTFQPGNEVDRTFRIKEGGRRLEFEINDFHFFQRAESDSIAIYTNVASYRLSFTSETEIKWEDRQSSKWVPLGTAVLKK